MNKRDFFSISIRGMVAYCVLCLESYVLETYADRDFAPVLRLAWDIVGPEGYTTSRCVTPTLRWLRLREKRLTSSLTW